ncbi:MAG: MurT ligase domain-containing protein [Mycobacterium leprae]
MRAGEPTTSAAPRGLVLVAAGSPTASLRAAAARAAGVSAAAVARRLRLGAGTTIGGRVALAIDPTVLRRAAATRGVTVISGTNGKTTTRVLLVRALSTRSPVVSNVGGANLPSGWTTTLVRDRHTPACVLEVDEGHLPAAIEQTAPRLAVLLNLTRDQLDRYAEVHRLASAWRAALASVATISVVANVDDPLVAWAAMVARDVRWVSLGTSWVRDATTCPACGAVIRVETRSWSCACGLRRPTPEWDLRGDVLHAPDGSQHLLWLRLPGHVNQANAAAAVAAAAVHGVPVAEAVRAVEGVATVEGRYEERSYRGRPVRLLLAKNPAGWQEALGMLPPPPAPVVLAINARIADGRDPAWLWDVPFERLGERVVVATGERARDLAVRLRYADVPHQRIDDPGAALLAAPGEGRVQVLGNYTAFAGLRRIVHDA